MDKYSNFKKCISEDTEHFIYTDIMEWHVVKLPKLPSIEDGTNLYNWIRFLKAEHKEEFEMLAKKDEYIEEAYKQLEIISQDEQKRLEYTARQKAIYDYNTLMEENWLRGKADGKAERDKELTLKFRSMGMSDEEISRLLE